MQRSICDFRSRPKYLREHSSFSSKSNLFLFATCLPTPIHPTTPSPEFYPIYTHTSLMESSTSQQLPSSHCPLATSFLTTVSLGIIVLSFLNLFLARRLIWKWRGWQSWHRRGQWWSLARPHAVCATPSRLSSVTLGWTRLSMSLTRCPEEGKSSKHSQGLDAQRCRPCSSAVRLLVAPMRWWVFTLVVP